MCVCAFRGASIDSQSNLSKIGLIVDVVVGFWLCFRDFFRLFGMDFRSFRSVWQYSIQFMFVSSAIRIFIFFWSANREETKKKKKETFVLICFGRLCGVGSAIGGGGAGDAN